jgi:adenosylcobinamide-GDP ribazoletransferase
MNLSPFWIALQFLSSLPIRLPGMPESHALGRSLLFYPLVGLLFGLLLMGLNALLSGTPTMLHAALLLTAWVLLSGGLHLDGLADSADAWLGGFGDRERTLTIMKDPRSGPIAVVTLVLVLLLKFCALLAVIEHPQSLALLLAPLIGRSAMLALFLDTPYVRAGGLGQALADHLPRTLGRQVLLSSAVGCVLLAGLSGLIALSVACVCFFWLRHLMLRRLGGTTGDTAGALLELLEVAVLVVLALVYT